MILYQVPSCTSRIHSAVFNPLGMIDMENNVLGFWARNSLGYLYLILLLSFYFHWDNKMTGISGKRVRLGPVCLSMADLPPPWNWCNLMFLIFPFSEKCPAHFYLSFETLENCVFFSFSNFSSSRISKKIFHAKLMNCWSSYYICFMK